MQATFISWIPGHAASYFGEDSAIAGMQGISCQAAAPEVATATALRAPCLPLTEAALEWRTLRKAANIALSSSGKGANSS